MNLQSLEIMMRSGVARKSFSCRKSVDKTSFAEIQQAVRLRYAKDRFNIGEEIMTHYTYDGTVYDMPWVVLDNDRECEWPDGSRHPGLWLGSKYATIEDIQFDAPEREAATEQTAQDGLFYCGVTNSGVYMMLNLNTGDPIPYEDYRNIYHSIVNDGIAFSQGYNRYLHSAYRQWLNSASGVGGWWTPQHIGDSAPEQLETVKGFMAGLDPDFLAVIHPVKVQVAANTVTDNGVTDVMYDRFFLQSIEEIYGSPQQNTVEGPYFPYWKQATGLSSPTNGTSSNTNNARKFDKIYNPSGIQPTIRLRSSTRNSASKVWIVRSSGYLDNATFAVTNYAALPACVIS